MRPLSFSPTNNAARPALQTMLLVGVESISRLLWARHHQRLPRHQQQPQHQPRQRRQRRQPRPVLHQQPLQRLRLDQHPLHGRMQHQGHVPRPRLARVRDWGARASRVLVSASRRNELPGSSPWFGWTRKRSPRCRGRHRQHARRGRSQNNATRRKARSVSRHDTIKD